MKLLFDPKRLIEKVERLEQEGISEPAGLLAVSPRILENAARAAGRGWDGTQVDAERLVDPYVQQALKRISSV